MELKEVMQLLTSPFIREGKSYVGKIIKIFLEQVKIIEDNLQLQLDWKNIDEAQGFALDKFGQIVGLPRGTWDDEMYRIRIKVRIAQNLSDGTINSVIETLAMALQTDVSTIKIESMWEKGQPDTIAISGIPFDVLNKAGMTTDQLVDMVKLIIAAGIRVETIGIEGTFRMSPDMNGVAAPYQFGLSDDAMTVGGTLSAILLPHE